MSLSVTVVGADNSDPRWRAVEEATAFWNQQLTEVGVNVRLGPITRLIQPVPDDALRKLSTAQLESRFEPDIPEGLRQIPGDIVVALGGAGVFSFYDVNFASNTYAPGDIVEVTWVRGGELHTERGHMTGVMPRREDLS